MQRICSSFKTIVRSWIEKGIRGVKKQNRTTKDHRPKVEAETRPGWDAASLCPCRSSVRENKLFRWVAGRWFTAKTSALILLWFPVSIYSTIVGILTRVGTGTGLSSVPAGPGGLCRAATHTHTLRKRETKKIYIILKMQLNLLKQFDMAAANFQTPGSSTTEGHGSVRLSLQATANATIGICGDLLLSVHPDSSSRLLWFFTQVLVTLLS